MLVMIYHINSDGVRNPVKGDKIHSTQKYIYRYKILMKI